MTGFSLRARAAAPEQGAPPINAFARRARELRVCDDLLADIAAPLAPISAAPARIVHPRSPGCRDAATVAPDGWRLGSLGRRSAVGVAVAVLAAAPALDARAEDPPRAVEVSSPTPIDPWRAIVGRMCKFVLHDGSTVTAEVLALQNEGVAIAREPVGVLGFLPRDQVREVLLLDRLATREPRRTRGPGQPIAPSGTGMIRAGTAMTVVGGVLLGGSIAVLTVSPSFLYYGLDPFLSFSGHMLGFGIPLMVVGKELKNRDRTTNLFVQTGRSGAVRVTVAKRL